MNEDAGKIPLTIEVNSAFDTVTLKREIPLNVSTHDGSAVGKPALRLIVENPTATSFAFQVAMIL